jgi:hypothetical protein
VAYAMTLREIKAILDDIPLDEGMLTQDGAVLGNLPAFKSVAARLATIPQFQASVQEIQASPLYTTGAEQIGFSPAVAIELKQRADKVILGAVGLKRLLTQTLPPIPPESILVKLPRDQALPQVVDVLADLQKALGQLVSLEGIEGEVQISSWETGSLLVFLYLKSIAAVDIVGRALRGAAIIYQEIQKGRILGQHVSILKVKAESARDLKDAQEVLLNELVEHHARAVETETFSSHDNERFERLKVSIRLLAELLDRGTTVYPTLEMPEESRKRFPDLERINTVLSEMKQLEDAQSSQGEAAALEQKSE